MTDEDKKVDLSVETSVIQEDVEQITKREDSDILNEELVKTLKEALRIDYIEKFTIFAQLKIVQRDLAEANIALAKYKRINKLVATNNKILQTEVVEAKGRHKFEKERADKLDKKNKELREQLKEVQDRFNPVEDPYVEEEVKPKRKRTRTKKEQIAVND